MANELVEAQNKPINVIAKEVAEAWEKVSRQARQGNLQDLACGKVISDIYEFTNGEPLPVFSSFGFYLKSWLANKEILTAQSNHRKYHD
jgi:hypothetical protein